MRSPLGWMGELRSQVSVRQICSFAQFKSLFFHISMLSVKVYIITYFPEAPFRFRQIRLRCVRRTDNIFWIYLVNMKCCSRMGNKEVFVAITRVFMIMPLQFSLTKLCQHLLTCSPVWSHSLLEVMDAQMESAAEAEPQDRTVTCYRHTSEGFSFLCKMLPQQCFCPCKRTRLALVMGRFLKFPSTKCSFVNKVELLAAETSTV